MQHSFYLQSSSTTWCTLFYGCVVVAMPHIISLGCQRSSQDSHAPCLDSCFLWCGYLLTLWSIDAFYTVYATGCYNSSLDTDSTIAQVVVSLVVIIEMVVAVIILNVAHYKIRLQVRGQQILMLEWKIHIIVIAVALIYATEVTVSFGLTNSDQNKVTVFFAIWFPLLSECNLFILCIALIRTTNNPLFCLQRKKAQWTYQTMNTEHYQTNPTSHPLNQPSYTMSFSAPYTNAFTQITAAKSQQDRRDDATYYREISIHK